MNHNKSLRQFFGLTAGAFFWSQAHEREAAKLRDGIESQRLLAIIAPFGSGKSTLVDRVLDDSDYKIARVNNPAREKLNIGQIVTAMVRQLGAEQEKRDNMARSFQIERILGDLAITQGRTVVVVIENAHRIDANTLLAIKDARESFCFKGKNMMFAVLLVGQEPLAAKLERFGEVAYRTKKIELTEQAGWFTYRDRLNYLERIYGEVITPESRGRLAAMFTTPLRLDAFIEERLEQMRDAGIKTMIADDLPLGIRERREALQVSVRDLAKAANLPKSTVHDHEAGRNTNPDVEAAIEAGLRKLKKAS